MMNAEFNLFQQQYFISVQYSESKKYTELNMSHQLWNKYKYFHRSSLNQFLLNLDNDKKPIASKKYFNSLIASLTNIFTKEEIESYVKLYLFETEQTIKQFNEIIIKRKSLFNTKLMMGYNIYLIDGTGNEELYCNEYIGLIQSFILNYTNKFSALKKLEENINNTDGMTLEHYNKMFKHYKDEAFNKYQPKYQPDDTLTIEINSTAFTDYENNSFIELNRKHENECDKVEKTLEKATAEYLEIWRKIHNMTYEIVETYSTLHIWEENHNSINIVSLVGLVVYYKDNVRLGLALNTCRCLCIPYLLLPTDNKINKLLMDLLHHPTAIPMFRTVNVPKIHALINLRSMIKLHTLPVINDIRTMFSTIKQYITDDEIDSLFDIEAEDTIITPKKKRTKRKKTVKKTIDISENNNEIIEIEPEPEIELVYENTSIEEPESSDDEEIVLDKIENKNNDTIVRFNKIPFNIIFYRYEYISYSDKDLITFMINELYNTNDKFKTFITQYDTIRIIQSFHKDFNGLNKSLHFNGVFYNTTTLVKSTVYHFYISNNVITSLTTIINVI